MVDVSAGVWVIQKKMKKKKKKTLISMIFNLTFRDNSILTMLGVCSQLSLYVFFSNGNRFFLKPEEVSLRYQFGSLFWH